jgi:hypothetical protein
LSRVELVGDMALGEFRGFGSEAEIELKLDEVKGTMMPALAVRMDLMIGEPVAPDLGGGSSFFCLLNC